MTRSANAWSQVKNRGIIRVGGRATTTDASGASSYTYDSRDRLKTKVTPQGTLTYTYDAASNVTRVAIKI